MKSDRQLITEAVRDYFEGWFLGDADRMERALHAGLAKRSLGRVDTDSPELHSVTKDQMVGWTAAGEGITVARDRDTTVDVRVVDLHGDIASVVVRSAVYREYLHLVRAHGEWRIVNGLWDYT